MDFIRSGYFRLLAFLLGAVVLLAVTEAVSSGIWSPKGFSSHYYFWFYGRSMEEIAQIPPWFWWIAGIIVSAFLTALIGILIFFGKRYISMNDDNWKEIREHMNTMVTSITLLTHRTTENEKSIDQIHVDIRNLSGGMPYIKHR